MVLAVVGLLVIPMFVWLSAGPPKPPIDIDGSFADWASVPMFDAATPAPDPNVQIARYGSLLSQDRLYLFASMQGNTFGDFVGYSGVDFLIDADGNASTGFSFGGLGADYVVQTYGGNETVVSAVLFSFPTDAGLNWSRRENRGAVAAAASAAGLELAVATGDLFGFQPSAYQVSVYADNFRGGSSRSEVFLTPVRSAILLDSRPLVETIGTGPTPFLEIRARAMGDVAPGDVWTVSSFRLASNPGLITSLSAESINLTRDQPTATITVTVQVPGFLPGTVVKVQLLGASGPRPITVWGDAAVAYYLAPPAGIRVDGLFADWIPYDVADTDAAPMNNSNVNIVRDGAVVNGTAAFFHVQVAGVLLDGAMPVRVVRTGPGKGSGGSNGTVVPIPRITGEDVLRVYVDLNASDPVGAAIGGISADYCLEVRGQGGVVTTAKLYAWQGSWVPVARVPVALAKNATDIEGSVGIGPTTNSTRVLFVTTDWSGAGDSSGPVLAAVVPALPPAGNFAIYGAPEFEDILIPLLGTLALVGLAIRRRREGSRDNS